MEQEKKEEVRVKIREIMKKAKIKEDNLSPREKIGFIRLKAREDIQIMQADKGGAITVMEKNWYEVKVKELVDEKFEQIKDEDVDKQIKERNKWLNKLVKLGKLEKKKVAKIKERDWETPKMLGFPKIHKEDVVLRPVVAGREDPKCELEEVLKEEIQTLLEPDDINRGIRDTSEAIREIEKEDLTKGILFSMDIKAMFPSIKREFLYQSIRDLITEKGDTSLNWVGDLLEWILNNSYCSNGDKLYKSVEGLPIESKLSPILA